MLGLLVDARHIPKWAPGFANVVDGDEQHGWRVSKDGQQFSLRVDVSWEAGTVDYLREIAPGREGGAYLRAAPRRAERTGAAPCGPNGADEHQSQ